MTRHFLCWRFSSAEHCVRLFCCSFSRGYVRMHVYFHLSSSPFFLFHSPPSFFLFQLRSEIDEIGRLLQEESLDLYPEMESRLLVLERLRLIDKETGVPTVKVRNIDHRYDEMYGYLPYGYIDHRYICIEVLWKKTCRYKCKQGYAFRLSIWTGDTGVETQVYT